MSSNKSSSEKKNSDSKQGRIITVVCGVILLFIIVTFVITLFVSLFTLSQPPNDFTESVGDQSTDSSALLAVNSSVYLVTIKLIQPQNVTANVYISSLEPPKTIRHFPQKSISNYYGALGHHWSYNYYGDQPIYLLPDSSITYMMNIWNNNSSTCPIQLYLFDNVISFDNFRHYQNYTAVASSPCRYENVTKSLTKFTWIFNITKEGSYYVGINIDTGINVATNVSAVRVYYNITGLKSPSECSQPLSASHLSCQMTLQCSKFYCNREKKYLLVKSTDKVEVSYSFLGPPTIDGRSKYILFIVSIIIIGCSILIIVIIVIACYIKKGCKNVQSTICSLYKQMKNSTSKQQPSPGDGVDDKKLIQSQNKDPSDILRAQSANLCDAFEVDFLRIAEGLGANDLISPNCLKDIRNNPDGKAYETATKLVGEMQRLLDADNDRNKFLTKICKFLQEQTDQTLKNISKIMREQL